MRHRATVDSPPSWSPWASIDSRPHGRCGQPSTLSSRSRRATGVASLAVATGDWHASPSRSPRATGSPPSRSPRSTCTRLPRGGHGRPVPRFSGSPRGDQLLVLPGRHGAVGATLTDNPPNLFNVPLMLPLENYDKTTKQISEISGKFKFT
ncbi:hypothetical protein DY000_02033957 [Brassica cretica]|uniref:Uncharacterized protein n=1 Tax=Brassica cretica TaxID=69181 RepID=A0ABQ7DDE6_BRACR|nr:hypothetical protein DY000_02033957 [Brassica cretica]